jgi:hypothetical protein
MLHRWKEVDEILWREQRENVIRVLEDESHITIKCNISDGGQACCNIPGHDDEISSCYEENAKYQRRGGIDSKNSAIIQ